MEQKIKKLLEKTTKIMGEDADILVLVHKDGKCGGIAHGSTEALAESIFANIHNSADQMSSVLYRIIKLNVLNILGNPTVFAGDLMEAIESVLPEMPEDDEEE